MAEFQERLGLRDWTVVPVRDINRLQSPSAAQLCNGAILISRRTFEALREYSRTLPTGVREGKVWKLRDHWGDWYLGRYGRALPDGHKYAGQTPITWHPLLIEGEEPRWPLGVRVPLRRIG